MSNKNNNQSTRQEIIDWINSQYSGIKFEEDEAIELTNDIFEIIIDKLHDKIKFCDQEMQRPENIAVNDCLGCIESKKKAFQEVISMLVKK